MTLMFALVPMCVWLAIELHRVWQFRRHDRVLFPICEARSKLSQYLVSERGGQALDRADFVYGRYMLEAMNNTVSMYRDSRTKMFNFRAMLRFLKEYEVSVKDIRKVPRTENARLRDIEQEYTLALVRGFMTYTHFLSSQFAAEVMTWALSMLAKAGVKKARALGARAREFFDVTQNLGNGNMYFAR